MQTLNKPRPFQNGKGPSRDGRGPLSTRGGTIVAALLSVVLAAAAIVLFINQYKDRVDKGNVPTSAIVAEQLIEKGASGDSLGAEGAFKPSKVPTDQLKAGAITDVAKLKGQVATTDILPGQQLTDADFQPAGSGAVTKLAATDRAVAVALDTAHGLLGTLRVGDHVDVLAGFLVDTAGTRPRAILRTVAQNILVLKVPGAGKSGTLDAGAGTIQAVTLRVSNTAAPKIAFAAEYGKLSLALRPANGADVPRRSLATIESLMFTNLANARVLRSGSAR